MFKVLKRSGEFSSALLGLESDFELGLEPSLDWVAGLSVNFGKVDVWLRVSIWLVLTPFWRWLDRVCRAASDWHFADEWNFQILRNRRENFKTSLVSQTTLDSSRLFNAEITQPTQPGCASAKFWRHSLGVFRGIRLGAFSWVHQTKQSS
jgi:hypothetical protein